MKQFSNHTNGLLCGGSEFQRVVDADMSSSSSGTKESYSGFSVGTIQRLLRNLGHLGAMGPLEMHCSASA